MRVYQVTEKIEPSNCNGEEPVLLDQQSHLLMEFKTGKSLIDYTDDESGVLFSGPLICSLDDEDDTGIMPPFFLSPAFIAEKRLVQVFIDFGIKNIEIHPVIILDKNNNNIENYQLVNIIGRVSCADMNSSIFESIDDDSEDATINVINELVIRKEQLSSEDLFLVHEDTDCIIISEALKTKLDSAGYTQIYYDEVQVI